MIHQVFLDTPPDDSIHTSYTGPVENIFCPVGYRVKTGDQLLEFEWPDGQMSLALNSEHAGVVTAVHVKVGEEIKSGDLLMEIDDEK